MAGGDPREAALPATGIPLDDLVEVRLEPSVAHLTPRQRQMLDRLIAAAAAIDAVFLEQGYGGSLGMAEGSSESGEHLRARINYGPWDRFRGNRPMIEGIDPKPAGAGFYPVDMTREEFESVDMPGKRHPRTVLRRAENGGLVVLPYSEAYRAALERAARSLAQAAALCDEPAFKRYLTLRARALITDDYGHSDRAWMGLESNSVDLIIGPAVSDEDGLFGYKSAYGAWVLLRDYGWNDHLSRIVERLTEVHDALPVSPIYRSSEPLPTSAPAIYDAAYLAGDANAGPKRDLVEMPLDEEGRVLLGSRRVVLRNVMQARFERFILPTAGEMIVADQQHRVRFDAFLDNALAASLAGSLGARTTVDGQRPVRQALADRSDQIEDGKADVLGMHVLVWHHDQGHLGSADLADRFVTFVASMFWDMHHEPASSRAAVRALQLNFLKAFGAVSRDRLSGRYRVRTHLMSEALASLATQLLVIAGNGDYQGAVRLLEDMGRIGPELEEDLRRLSRLDLPIGMVFEQGPEVLGLR